MTRLRTTLATAAAGAMLFTTTAAAAAPVASAPMTRAATPVAQTSNLGPDVPTTTLISIGILAALVVIVLVATNGSNDDSPNSP